MKTKWRILTLTAICGLLLLGLAQLSISQTTGTVVSVAPSQASAREGQTLTLNLTISNVENLYGVDIMLKWNTSILNAQNAVSLLGLESHLGGVLHEKADYPVIIVEDSASQATGEYHLVATSQGLADSFNGSGIAAILTFNVTSAGHTQLTIQSELADHPQPGETTSELIPHTDVEGIVNATPVPEFPEIAVMAMLAAVVSIALLYRKKLSRKNAH